MIETGVQHLQTVIAQGHCLAEALSALLLLVAGNVFVTDDIATHGNEERGLIGTHNGDLPVGTAHRAALRLRCHQPHKPYGALQPLMLPRDTVHKHSAAWGRGNAF